jgi:uncharacterized tellurite resistance protein B-like protein
MAETDDMGGVAAFINGAGTAEAAVPITEAELIKERRPGGWYTKLVAHYVRKNVARRAARGAVTTTENPHDRSVSAIRWACAKSAASGALCGMISTAATVITAETEGLAGIVAGPLAALTIGGEMILRTILHVELTCELAEIFDVDVDPDNADDLWRLYGLAFGTHGQDDGEGDEDPSKETITEMGHVEGEEIGEKIGSRVLGESVMRNIVPVLGIFTSAVTNFLMTRRLGNTVRRYMRYQHALDAEGSFASEHCHAVLDLVIEGIWFIFSADGKLEPEEITFLNHMLKKLDPISRKAVTDRFVEDELEWTIRVKKEVPEDLRDTFLHVLEVAAAVDKEVGLPERKILRRAAHALGREWSEDRVKKMIEEFEETGELSDKHAACRPTAEAAATPTA